MKISLNIMPERILQIAVPAPLHGLFDYLPPKGVDAAQLRPGQRVLVPFGHRSCCGILVRTAAHSEFALSRLKAATAVLDEEPVLDARHMRFLRWVADYYHAPIGEVLMAALPVRLRKGKAPLQSKPRYVQLAKRSNGAEDADLRRAPRQQQLLCWLREQGGQAMLSELRAAIPQFRGALQGLQKKGLLTLHHDPPPIEIQNPNYQLQPEQQQAVARISSGLHGYAAHLLDGVTGSGKTEVFLRVAEQVLAAGRQVLLLVPEIALTPQLVRHVQSRLCGPLALLHSGRNDTDRELAWRAAAKGRARVLLGTRSAVLAPLPELGLVIVDEEQDTSYKQQQGIRYSARDLALVRARQADCPVILGSATPALESLKNALDGRYSWLRLTHRAGVAQAPAMRLLDIRNQRLRGGMSPHLLEALAKTLQQGHQAMLFLNRRGFAPVLSCYSCGWLSDCPRCDARQTVHRRQHRLICHHCGSERPLPSHCPNCHSPELHPLGQGTEQLEQVLRQQFPDHPLVRIDRDAVSAKGSLEDLLQQARDGRASLLVGTQMLAKGHHFPGVALVAMIDVDGGLFGADFRAAERMAQLIIQVAGRAGRGRHPGQVLMQTRFPAHPMLQTLIQQDYAAFARQALDERRVAALPPFSHQALIRASAVKAEIAEAFLGRAATWVAKQAAAVQLWGPVPAPMQKKAGRYRAQLLLQSDDRRSLQALLKRLTPGLGELPDATRVRWSVDVDPVDLY